MRVGENHGNDIKKPQRATRAAIPTDFIRNLITQPENAGHRSSVLSWLLRKWEEEHATIKSDDDCFLIASPDAVERLLESNKDIAGCLCICTWLPKGTVLVVKDEAWNHMVDDAEVWGMEEERW